MMTAASAARLDRMDEARGELQKVLKVLPELTQHRMRKSPTYTRPQDAEFFVGGFAKAGLPE